MKTKSIIIWAVVVILFVGSIWWLSQWGGEPTPAGQSVMLVPSAASDWKLGKTDAKVTLVEYGDYECPACGAYFPLVKQITQEFSDKLLFIFRQFPLRNVHQYAQLAAEAAEAAGVQGKFWEMHDLIYQNQTTWANSADANSIFLSYAQSLGLNIDKFKSDMDSGAVQNKIEADYQSGIKSNVQGTPTFFLNGKNFPNPRSYEEFKGVIEAALQNANF